MLLPGVPAGAGLVARGGKAAARADDAIHLAKTAAHLDDTAKLASHADEATELIGHADEVVAAAREAAGVLGLADEAAHAVHAAPDLLEAGTWRQAEEMVGKRLGVEKNTTRYFEEGMRRSRIPDFITEDGVYEVKFYSRTTLYATAQLRDEAILARYLGKSFYVVVREGTNVQPSVFKLTKQTGGDVLRWIK